MRPEWMFDESPPQDPWTEDQILEMWPQAHGELMGFAKALERNAKITASQLRLAIRLADCEYYRMRKKKEEG